LTKFKLTSAVNVEIEEGNTYTAATARIVYRAKDIAENGGAR
jgi:hypothetical protein